MILLISQKNYKKSFKINNIALKAARSLTTGANSFTGKSGADTFDGSLNSNNQQTLTTADNLTGAAGTDTLTATLNSGLTVRPTLSGIEKLDLTAVTSNSAIDLASATGVTTVSAVSSSAAWHSPNSVDKYYCQNLNGRNANAKSQIHS